MLVEGVLPLQAAEEKPEMVLQLGHRATVAALAFSRDVNTVVSAGDDKVIKIWDAATGGLKRELGSLGGREIDDVVSLSPDGTRAVTGAGVGPAFLGDLDGTTQSHKLMEAHNGLNHFAFSPDGQTLAASDETHITLWNAKDGKQLRVWKAHENSMTSLAFSSDGSTLISGGLDGAVRLWDASTGIRRRTWKLRRNAQPVVAFSSDGKWIAGGDGNAFVGFDASDEGAIPEGERVGEIRVWDARSGRLQATLYGDMAIRRLRFFSDGTQLGVQGGMKMRVFAVPSGKLLLNQTLGTIAPSSLAKVQEELKAQTSRSFHFMVEMMLGEMAISPDGKTVATAAVWASNPTETGGNDVLLWRRRDGKLQRRLRGFKFPVYAVASSPDEKFLVGAGAGVAVWDVANARLERAFSGDELTYDLPITSATWAQERALWLETSGFAPQAWRRENTTWRRALIQSPRAAKTKSPADDEYFDDALRELEQRTKVLTAGGRRENRIIAAIVEPTNDGREAVQLWRAKDGNWLRRILIPVNERTMGEPKTIALAPDGSTLAIGDHDALHIFETGSGRLRRSVPLPLSGRVQALAISPDNRTIAVASEASSFFDKREVAFVNLQTGRIEQSIATKNNFGNPIRALQFSPDGSTLIASGERRLRAWRLSASAHELIWDVASLLPNLEGGASSEICFWKEGRFVVSAGKDGAVEWRDARDGQLAATARLLEKGQWIFFTPEGFYNASPGAEKWIRWRVGNQLFRAEKFKAQFHQPTRVSARLAVLRMIFARPNPFDWPGGFVPQL